MHGLTIFAWYFLVSEISYNFCPICVNIFLRTPGRWQYKTTSKPRVTIRKQNVDETPKEENVPTPASLPQEANPTSLNEVVVPQARSDDVDSLEGSESIASIVDDPSTSENKLEPPAFPVETLKVEISTPPDFGDIYYEIATIKSPYTFQVRFE